MFLGVNPQSCLLIIHHNLTKLLRLDEFAPKIASNCFALLRAKNQRNLLRKLRARYSQAKWVRARCVCARLSLAEIDDRPFDG